MAEHGAEADTDVEESKREFQEMEESSSDDDSDGDIYEVERIIGVTKMNGKTMYKVRWRGYGPSWDTWEPYENLEACVDMIEDYLQRQKQLKLRKKEQSKKKKELRVQTRSNSSDGDSRSSELTPSEKKKPSYFYVASNDEASDTLKDKFWRNLEQGKVDVFACGDLYTRVKGTGRSSRPTSFKEDEQDFIATGHRSSTGSADKPKKKRAKTTEMKDGAMEGSSERFSPRSREKKGKKPGRKKSLDGGKIGEGVHMSGSGTESLGDIASQRRLSESSSCVTTDSNSRLESMSMDVDMDMHSVASSSDTMSSVIGVSDDHSSSNTDIYNDSNSTKVDPDSDQRLTESDTSREMTDRTNTASPHLHQIEQSSNTAASVDQDQGKELLSETLCDQQMEPTDKANVSCDSVNNNLFALDTRNEGSRLGQDCCRSVEHSSSDDRLITTDGSIVTNINSEKPMSYSFKTHTQACHSGRQGHADRSGGDRHVSSVKPSPLRHKRFMQKINKNLKLRPCSVILEPVEVQTYSNVRVMSSEKERSNPDKCGPFHSVCGPSPHESVDLPIVPRPVSSTLLKSRTFNYSPEKKYIGNGQQDSANSSSITQQHKDAFSDLSVKHKHSPPTSFGEDNLEDRTTCPLLVREDSVFVAEGLSATQLETKPESDEDLEKAPYSPRTSSDNVDEKDKDSQQCCQVKLMESLMENIWSGSFEVDQEQVATQDKAMVSREVDPFLSGHSSQKSFSDVEVDTAITAPVLTPEFYGSPMMFDVTASPSMPDLHDAPLISDYQCLSLPVELGHSPVCSPVPRYNPPNSVASLDDRSDHTSELEDTACEFDLDDLDSSDWEKKETEKRLLNDSLELTNAEFRQAVRDGNYDRVRRALKSKRQYNLETADNLGYTLAMCAAQNGYDDILELLILSGANINAQQKNGFTALMHACEQGHLCTVALLLELGAHMNLQQNSGESALMKAVKRGHKEIVHLLLEHGVNFATRSLSENTALKIARLHNFRDTQNLINEHISKVTAAFESQVCITLNNTARILCALFPIQCFSLNEAEKFHISFKHELQPTIPGVGMLLFIAHARINRSEIRCRLYGPCAVTSAVLNGIPQSPLTEEANFVLSLSPLANGKNDLEINVVRAPNSKAKLVVCAYKAQLTIPPD